MREWALKHPLMTFTLTAGTIMGILNVFKIAIAASCAGKIKVEPKEEKQDEPAGDNQ